ncbi:MAG: hypothetical protein V3V01_01700 [Acidimicrobiales bacterium]
MSKNTLFQVEISSDGGMNRAVIYEPPVGGQKIWEFGNESYPEIVSAVLNKLTEEGYELLAIDPSGGAAPLYVLSAAKRSTLRR